MKELNFMCTLGREGRGLALKELMPNLINCAGNLRGAPGVLVLLKQPGGLNNA